MNTVVAILFGSGNLGGGGKNFEGNPRFFPLKKNYIPYAKNCACNMHVPTNCMHVMVNMHVTLLLHECYMHVVRVLEMVAHVPCMLYEC